MALTAAFDIETRQYDAINAFANAKLPKLLLCQCAKGYKKENMLL